MSASDSLGDRMKQYEAVPRLYLMRHVPVIIRLDGKAFHTFTKGMCKPFDIVLTSAMQETMYYLCENIQGCVFGYTQSDEITLVLTDYKTPTTDAWYGYGVQKMASVAASMATLAFNKAFAENVGRAKKVAALEQRVDTYEKKLMTAMFDARVFSLPVDEVCNCLIWRQQDAVRNSIEAVGQANFSHKELQGKSCAEVQEMLWKQKHINWNDLPVYLKRGAACRRQKTRETIADPRGTGKTITVERNRWAVDLETPTFTQDRDYINSTLA